MKCECGEKIKLLDVILPWRTNYVLRVIDDDGTLVEKIRICKKCHEKYDMIMTLVARVGLEEVVEMLKKLGDE